MNKERKKRFLSAITLCAVTMSLMTATSCGKPGDKKKKIAVITKNKKISFWNDVKAGAEDAGDELGYEILYTVADSDNDFSTQVAAINDAIDEDVEAIIIAPNGKTELNDALKKAQDKGITIININSTITSDDVKVASLISSSDKDGGDMAARQAADGVLLNENVRNAMKAMQQKGGADYTDIADLGRGSVGIVQHSASTGEARVEGFKASTQTEVIRQLKEDKVDLEKWVVASQNSDQPVNLDQMFEKFFVTAGDPVSSVEDAKEQAMTMLQADDCNLKCIFATNTNTTLGVCEAIRDLNKQEEVYVIGFNSDEQELAYLRTGELDGTIIQNPYNMGYVGVRYAKKIEGGSRVPKTLDTGVTWVDAKNMNDDYIQLLIHPNGN
jgi:ribose transport system substrate-binding protein